ncbi:MAG: Asp-tRNA(Asn)/Glu-tRNA(Gln) amidotransferase subunit GatC [Candidatus Magasanikbacteria bacterium]|nr:Asp-tRNA(Asn)/Glu-tRNA(Gln) amidotransferase subunit GatC [Candidatus Magasanikbacteria bacterium]
MKLSVEQIEEIAKLARLELSKKEKKMYAEQLTVVLDYVETLNEVDTDNVPETCQVTGLEDVVRKDEVKKCEVEVQKKLIDSFQENMGKLLKVKAVFGGLHDEV